jgi:hypothetical protein
MELIGSESHNSSMGGLYPIHLEVHEKFSNSLLLLYRPTSQEQEDYAFNGKVLARHTAIFRMCSSGYIRITACGL